MGCYHIRHEDTNSGSRLKGSFSPLKAKAWVIWRRMFGECVGEPCAALHSNYARLRGAVAASIHRRKVPELSFQAMRE